MLTLITFAVFNCENDKFELVEEPTQKVLDIKAYRFSTDSIFKVNSTLKTQITKKFSTKNNSYTSRLTSEEYGFSIDTSRVQLLVANTYESFTFVVEREEYNPDVLENYVLTIYNDNTYNQLLISYPIIEFDGEVAYDIDNATGLYINDTSLLSRNDCGPGEVPIASWQQTVCININCGLSGDHSPGQPCSDGVFRARVECEGAWVTNCFSGSGGGGSTYTTTTNTTQEDDDTAVIPFVPDYVTDIMDCLNGPVTIGEANDNTELETQLNTLSGETQLEIKRYLLRDNNCSPEAQEFAILTIEAFQDNDQDGQLDGDVDFEEGIIYSLDNLCQRIIVMEASSNCSPINQGISAAFEANDDYTLVYKQDNDLVFPENANTYGNCSGISCEVNVEIRTGYLETATDLAIARTVAHENVHALLLYLHFTGGITTTDSDPDFVALAEAYANTLGEEAVLNEAFDTLEDAHHHFITSLVEDIATSVSAYGSSQGYSLPFSYYKKMSWEGLTQTSTFTQEYPSVSERNEVNAIIESENENHPVEYLTLGGWMTANPNGEPANTNMPCE